MKTIFPLRWLLVLLATLIFYACGPEEEEAAVAGRQPATGADYVEGELLVGLRSDAVRAAAAAELLPGTVETGRIDLAQIAAAESVFPQAGRTAEAGPRASTVVRLQLPANLSVEAAVAALAEKSGILYAEPNYRVRRAAEPNDPFFFKQWGLRNIGQTLTGDKGTATGTPGADIDATTAWDHTTGDGSVVAAALDSGIDYEHPDLAANIWNNPGETGTDFLGRDKGGNGVDDDGNGFVDDVRGWNFIGNNPRPLDDDVDGHGTHVAGIVGALGNDGSGVAGINWQVRLMPLKFLDRFGGGDLFTAAAAYSYAVRNGARVINASYTYPQSCIFVSPSQVERDAIAAARAAGVLVVAAAGNFGCNNDIYSFYPGSHPLDNILAVAATDPNDSKISWSNYGAANVDLGAPGLNIYSTVRQALRGLDGNFGYDYLSGTSMAAPHVTGAAALLWSMHPALTYAEIRDVLLATTDPLPALSGRTVSGGRLNLARALALDISLEPPAAPADLAVEASSADAVHLAWRDLSANEDRFVIERQSADGTFAPYGQVPADTVRFTDTAPSDGRQAVYRVKAVAGIRSSPYSNEATVLVPLRAPANLTAVAGETTITLFWRDVSEAAEEIVIERKGPDEAGFSVLATLPPDAASYADADVAPGTLYLYRLLTRNALAGDSAYAGEISAMIPVAGKSGGGGGSSCFIATAAWGTPFAAEIDNLRRFRDRVLLPHRAGRMFVEAYYRWSPPVAAFIARHESVRTVVRAALEPVAWLAGVLAPGEADGNEAEEKE